MRKARGQLLLPLGAVLAAAAIAGCGGGGGGTTSTSTTANGPAGTAGPKTAKALPGHFSAKPPHSRSHPAKPSAGEGNGLTRASAMAAERRARRRQRAAFRRLQRKAGRAAPFLVPVGDNSVPTYGGESSDSQRAQAEASLRSYLEARAAGDWSAACAQMAQVQKQLALLAGAAQGKGCATAYATLSKRIPASARANPLLSGLSALRVKSPHAFALFYGPRRQQYAMPMVSEGGAWKVNQLDPIPWPLGAPTHAP